MPNISQAKKRLSKDWQYKGKKLKDLLDIQ